VRASTAFVRLLIRGLAWDAEIGATTFAAALKSAAQAKLTDSRRGKVLVGTSSGGTAVQYTLPPLGDLTADDVAVVLSELLDHVDEIVTATPAITDTALKTALLNRFVQVYATRPDFSSGLSR
jgi:hypothetical protein